MELNHFQLKAVETIDRNVVVNAGAGTGKTKVLTERYIYLLEHGDLKEPNEIESIVAITFTNKATQEMVERIRDGIRSNISKGNKWRRFYRDLERANISTIHGFCAKILRENPIEAEIDPCFEVLDDVVSAQLLSGSIINVLNDRVENDKNTFNMMLLLNQNKIDNLSGDIKSLYNNIRTVGLSFNEVKQDTMDYLDSLEINSDYIDEIKDTIVYLIGKSKRKTKLYQLQDNQIWLDFLEDKYDEEDIYTHIEFLKDNIGTMKNEQETIYRVKDLMDSILLTKDKEYSWLYDTLTDILIDIDNVYTHRKKEVGGLDYDDLQNMVLDLLDNEKILRKYQGKYRYFMIDEFQDTNELQKKIFYRLATIDKALDRQNLFIVGDPKQSIYGFRGADIDVFYDVIEDITENKGKAISLKINYRSFNTILNFVNDVFSKVMLDRYDELLFNKESEHDIDIEILEDAEERNSEESSVFEAQAIAKRIKILVQQGKYKYKDIALLFRASTRNHIYEEAFKDYSIPYYNSSSKRFFYRQEVFDIINGLKTISNPYDNIAAIGFLRGPMIGLKDTSIYWLLRYLDKNLYRTILEHKDNSIFAEEERLKLDEAANLLGYFYKVKNLYSVSEILNLLIEKTLFVETSLLKAESSKIIANIYKFIEMTNEYYRQNNNSLEEYIDYIEGMKSSQESEGVIQSEEEDVVKLITIHSSKGLQFPVVIIPEMAKKNSGGYSPSMLYNKNIGIGIKTDESKGIYKEINEIKKTKEAEELERVLYVAVTRAEEMLILGCYGKDSGFKKLIKDYIPSDKIRLISDTELAKDIHKPVKTIEIGQEDTHRVRSSSHCRIIAPLLYEIDSFNTKEFVSYNISQYQKFNQCNRKFYLEYYWGLNINTRNEDDGLKEVDPQVEIEEDSFPLMPIIKGNIVHKFCQMYRRLMDRDELITEIVNSYGIVYSEGVREQLKPYIDNYLKYYNEDYDEVYSERIFHLRMGNKYIKGYIDRINIKTGKIEILDFKTNKIWNRNKLIEFYEPQLQLYAYAVSKILNIKVQKASIFFLEDGFQTDINISDEALENNLRNINEFINFVENHKDLDSYGKVENCDEYCHYREFCKF